MSLIVCPDCGNQVSARAPSCPKCACPISQPVFSERPRAQVIELTSKKYKGRKLLAIALIILGFIIAVGRGLGSEGGSKGGQVFAAITLTSGFILYVFSRMAAWWNHG